MEPIFDKFCVDNYKESNAKAKIPTGGIKNYAIAKYVDIYNAAREINDDFLKNYEDSLKEAVEQASEAATAAWKIASHRINSKYPDTLNKKLENSGKLKESLAITAATTGFNV